MGALCMIAATGAAPVDPYQLFAHTRQVWATQRYPDYLSYTVAVNVTEGGVDKAKHYRLAFDAQSGRIQVNPVSVEEQAAPPVPTGFVIHLRPQRQQRVLFDKKVGNPGEAVDYLGVPVVSPTYSFGMARGTSEGADSSDDLVAQVRRQFNDPMPAVKGEELASSGNLKTIALVASHVRQYAIALAGVENVASRECYHLLLTPLYDPKRLRLRELWIDTQTYETRQLISAGNFTGSNVPWLITFDDVNGALYISSERALAPVGVGDHRYERASISFDEIVQTGHPTAFLGSFVTHEDLMQEPGSGAHQ